MKHERTYQKPQMEVLEMKCSQMLALSDGLKKPQDYPFGGDPFSSLYGI